MYLCQPRQLHLLWLARLHLNYELEACMASDGALRLLNGFVRRGDTAFSAAEFRHGMGMSPQATSNLLTRLTKVGLVDRVAAGRYAIRQIGTLGTAAVWDDLGSAVAAVLVGHPHRVGFLTALDHHGLLVRPVREVQVASWYRPREKSLSGRRLRVVREDVATVLVGTEPLGPSRVATIERALLDVASRPALGGISCVAEALGAAERIVGLGDLAMEIKADAGFRRIGSIATSLSLPVGRELEPPRWRTLVELDRKARSGKGWVDKAWGVAWAYPKSELLAVVTS